MGGGGGGGEKKSNMTNIYPAPFPKRTLKRMEVSQDLRHLQMLSLCFQISVTPVHVSRQPLSDLWQKNPALMKC